MSSNNARRTSWQQRATATAALGGGSPMTPGNGCSIDAWQERSSRILFELKGADAFHLIVEREPWSAPSLDALERKMLDTWPSPSDIPADLAAQYEAFLGEGLRRLFGGTWVYLDSLIYVATSEIASSGLGIKYPDSETVDVVSSLIPFAYRARTGTWWSSNFQITEKLIHAR